MMDVDDIVKDVMKIQARAKWKHGFSQCSKCKAKLMAYLEKGHSLDDVINHFETMWQKEPRENSKNESGGYMPKIKNIRRFAMNAIRQAAGDGIYDNYIVEHADRLWTPRNPVLATGEIAEKLKKDQKIAAARGRYLIADEKAVIQLRKELLELEDEQASKTERFLSGHLFVKQSVR